MNLKAVVAGLFGISLLVAGCAPGYYHRGYRRGYRVYAPAPRPVIIVRP